MWNRIARRAGRYARLVAPGRFKVYEPTEAILIFDLTLNARQQAMLRATRYRTWERIKTPAIESPNWMVHLVSLIAHHLVHPPEPLEKRMAHRLRRDL